MCVSTIKKTLWLTLVVGVLLTITLGASVTFAQTSAPQILPPDSPIKGTVDANNPVQVYTFVGTAGQTATVTLTVPGGGAALLLTDAAGARLSSKVAEGGGSGTSSAYPLALENVSLPGSGNYYVTVLPNAFAAAPMKGEFELVLTLTGAIATPVPASTQYTPPGQVLTSAGLQVSLSWNTLADLNLQVRDPLGSTLYWDSRTTTNGGRFGSDSGYDANGLCQVETPNPTEIATLPAGAITTGSYEVLVFYRQACKNSGDTPFTVNVTLNGTPLAPIQGTLQTPAAQQTQEKVFVTSFTVKADGSASAGKSGVYGDINSLPVAAETLIASAQPITPDTPVQGSITTGQPFQTYSFTGKANQIVSIKLQRAAGSFDTLVQLLDASGHIVDANDDTAFNVTDSFIRNRNLPADGTYYIVASRYGKDLGGTEGTFNLTLSGATEDLPQAVKDLNLPTGDIEISLAWSTNADLQLLVRDPAGNSVYDDTPTIPSGGRLAANGNVNCTRTQKTPVSYIYWPQSFARPGSYEVEVWYQNQCNDANAVEFSLNIAVKGQVIFADVVRPLPNQKYVTSFTLDLNGQAKAGQGGIVGGSETLNYQAEADTAPQLTAGQTLNGNITPDNKFDVYTFQGQAGSVVSVSMKAVPPGKLDATLFLIDPDGVEVASNDDAVPNETTDSLISKFTLAKTGRYIVIATHFGTVYGGTTGPYTVTLTQAG